MINRRCAAAALFAALMLLHTAPATAQGETIITQAKANAGNVTPGDAAGFPVTLSRSGAYVFASNLTVPAGRNGLAVLSHNVDIDMNGFRLDGGGAANIGVLSGYGQSRIHHGFIVLFTSDGIRLVGNSNAWTVENMQIIQNGGSGISAVASAYSRYINNNIVVNGGPGIYCGDYCHVEGNTISDKGTHGVDIKSGTVLGNSIFSNAFYGIVDPTANPQDTGFGNNTIVGNYSNGRQVYGAFALQPNLCKPTPC
jgi:hypothetical protein